MIPLRLRRTFVMFTIAARSTRTGRTIPMLLRLIPLAAMLLLPSLRRLVLPAVRHPAVLLLDHRAQFLHLPRERPNLIVHPVHRRARPRSRPALRRNSLMPRHSARMLS